MQGMSVPVTGQGLAASKGNLQAINQTNQDSEQKIYEKGINEEERSYCKYNELINQLRKTVQTTFINK